MNPAADLSAVVTTPTGEQYRLDPASPDPQKQPLDISLSSESGRGCADASFAINRPAAAEYADLKLLNEVALYLPDGRCVYDGRARGVPIGETWGFAADGWWSHGEQRKFTELLVDRDLNAWGDGSNSRKAALIGTLQPNTPPSVLSDGALPGIKLVAPAHVAGKYPISEAWYDAGSSRIASIYHDLVSVSVAADVGNWRVADTDAAVGETIGSDLLTGTNSSSAGTHTPTTAKRYAYFTFYADSAATTTEKSVILRELAVYGNHGLPKLARSDGPDGIAASGAIRYVAGKYAPKWDVSGVEDTTYPIPHAVWKEPVTATEAIQQLNSVHLWRLGVWPGRKLEFAPYDLTTADWQVRAGEGGVSVEAQGDTTENVFNGCCVNYNGFDGKAQRVTPDVATDLADDSDWIAANQWGDKAWMEIDVSWPCTSDDAVQIGRLALAAANRPARPSTITVPMHIQDGFGGWHPSSVVRADQTIAVLNQGSSEPRLITRASWSNHTLTLTTDNAIDSLAAFNARVTGALTAAGIA